MPIENPKVEVECANHNPKFLFKENKKNDNIYAHSMTWWLFVGKSRFYHLPSFNDTYCMLKFSWGTLYKLINLLNFSQIWKWKWIGDEVFNL